VAIRRDLVKRDAGHRLGGAEERLCGCHVAMLAEQHIDQGPVSVDGAIQVGPVTAKLCKMAATLRNTRFVQSAGPNLQENGALRHYPQDLPSGEMPKGTMSARR